ncbi:sarcosine oxidase [Actinoplanes lutulentus]|uniref:Sarcosine oxidase n=1 Tax=Actinoplanes lutulentus TaxID=1287878 RepID=A0A327ZD08_9ACTN|nr:N-methyl-L-tryptophan oxidase [Actinoplanes lutulentus]MBB2942695.1 sarcosine oxidase [Actinoplanes lutulentus]RAK38276.1 sarcosine oxidase [Actinoplanes lutulentus]
MIDVVVVGGGAMGSAAAWQLARRGKDVLLLERFAPGHHQGASHGASRIFRLVYAEPDYIALARRALTLWSELESATGTDLLDLTGGVDHGDPALVEPIAAAMDAAGVPGQWLARDEAAERWPGLRFDGPAFFHPSTGRVHADHAVTALQAAAASQGAVVKHETPVRHIVVRGNDHAEVVTDDGVVHARRVVVAVGAWTSKLLPFPVSLTVTQEQPAHFTPLSEDVRWPSFIHHGHEVYGMLTPGEGVKVGLHGTGIPVDPDSRDFAAEPSRAAQLADYVRSWVPGVDPATAAPISCTYTTTPTSDFIVDRTGPLVVAAGFSGHGFKFTPAIGELVADLAGGASGPHRFSFAARDVHP